MKKTGNNNTLTKIQKETILKATKENDYCTIAHSNTMRSLDKKGIAEYTNGFGYKFGEIIQLTEKGKQIQANLNQ